MHRGLELTALSVATVVLHVCASIVHVEVTVAGATAAVTVMVLVESVCLGLWLVARSQVGQERTPKENSDEETQFRVQQGTPCSNGDTGTLATCMPVEIMRWDRGDDRRAELLECHGGVTLWQAAKWVGGAGRHRHVRQKLFGLASTATSTMQISVAALCGTV